MGARTLYPAPPCPDCKKSSRVYNTAYTEDGKILRNRHCDWYGKRWWTLQTQETSLDPLTHRVELPSSFTNNKHLPARILRITPCNNSPGSPSS